MGSSSKSAMDITDLLTSDSYTQRFDNQRADPPIPIPDDISLASTSSSRSKGKKNRLKRLFSLSSSSDDNQTDEMGTAISGPAKKKSKTRDFNMILKPDEHEELIFRDYEKTTAKLLDMSEYPDTNPIIDRLEHEKAKMEKLLAWYHDNEQNNPALARERARKADENPNSMTKADAARRLPIVEDELKRSRAAHECYLARILQAKVRWIAEAEQGKKNFEERLAAIEQKRRQEDREQRELQKKLDQDRYFETMMRENRNQQIFEKERIRMGRVHSAREHNLAVALNEANANLTNVKNAYDTLSRQTGQTQKGLEIKHRQAVADRDAAIAKAQRAASENAQAQLNMEHAWNQMTTRTEELKELQRIEHEDKIAQSNRRNGLPPAYGSLDDDPYAKAPYGQHEDGGHAHLSMLPKFVRDNFSKVFDKAQYTANEHRQGDNAERREAAGTVLLLAGTCALYETCVGLHQVLDRAQDVEVLSRGKQKNRRDDDDEVTSSRLSRVSLVADRAAKLIMECCWHIIAAIDLRHFEIHLSAVDKAKLGVHWRIIDDTLQKAIDLAVNGHRKSIVTVYGPTLGPGGMTIACPPVVTNCTRCDSSVCTGHCDRMYEFTVFQTQLRSILARLDHMTRRQWNGNYFGETLNWMSEMIETERRLSASCYIPPTASPSPREPPPPSPTLVNEPIAGGSSFNFTERAESATPEPMMAPEPIEGDWMGVAL